MHCGILTVGHKKMSKSLGNFQTLREVAENFPLDVIRFFLVSGHYRMSMEYGDHLLQSAAAALDRIKNCRDSLPEADNSAPLPDNAKIFRRNFEAAMDDDFNTADAIAVIFEMVKHINVSKPEPGLAGALRAELDSLCGILGIWFEKSSEALDSDIEALIAARQEARKQKDFAESDRIRDELSAMGIELKDSRDGVKWTRK
jgi:cysteinyl-tRNA synthetase